MAKFYLIRHGQKKNTAGDPPLSGTGVKQAQATAKFLENKSIAAVASGPLLRTLQTAKKIAQLHKLEVIIDSRLRERANWGDLNGQSFEDFVKMWNYCSQNREYKPEVGDSAWNCGKRLESIIWEYYRQKNDGEYVLATHAGIITDFLFNMFDGKVLKQVNLDFFEKQNNAIGECSITSVDLDGEKFSLGEIGSIKHLTGI